MAVEKDHLSNEVSIQASVTETGVSLKAKSRAVAAIERFVGALADVPAAKLETWAKRIRNKGRVESATYDAAVARIETAVGSEAETAQLLDEVVASHVESVANRRHVAHRAIEYLALPGPDTASEPESAAEEIDPDWLGHLGA